MHGVISNPANIVDSRFKSDINLIGVSGLIGNDYYSAKFGDILKDDFDFDDDGTKSPKNANNAYGNVDILGPSFMFNINSRNSLAIFTRGRVFLMLTISTEILMIIFPMSLMKTKTSM